MYASTLLNGTPQTLLDAAEHVALKHSDAAHAQFLGLSSFKGALSVACFVFRQRQPYPQAEQGTAWIALAKCAALADLVECSRCIHSFLTICFDVQPGLKM